MSDSCIPTTLAESDPNLQSKQVFLTTSTGGHLVTIPPQNLAERRYANGRIRKAPPSKEYPGHDQLNNVKGPPRCVRKTKTTTGEPVLKAAPISKVKRPQNERTETPVTEIKIKEPPKKACSKKKSPKPTSSPKRRRKAKEPLSDIEADSSPKSEAKQNTIKEALPAQRIKEEILPVVNQKLFETSDKNEKKSTSGSPPTKRKKVALPQKVQSTDLPEPNINHALLDGHESDISSVPNALGGPAVLPPFTRYKPTIPRHWEVFPCENYDPADVLMIHPSLESVIDKLKTENTTCILFRRLNLCEAENQPLLPLENPAPYSCYLKTANIPALLFTRKLQHSERMDFVQLKRHIEQKCVPSIVPAMIYYLEFISDQTEILSRDGTVTQYNRSVALARCFCETLNNKVEKAVVYVVDFVCQFGTREVIASLSVLLRFVNSMAEAVIMNFLVNCQKPTQALIQLAIELPISDPYYNLIRKLRITMPTKLPRLVVIVQNVVQKRYNRIKHTVFHDVGYKHLSEDMKIYFPRRNYDVREIVVKYKDKDKASLLESVNHICRSLRQCVYSYDSVTVIGLGTEALLVHKAAEYVDGLDALICVNPEMTTQNNGYGASNIPVENYSKAYCPVMFVIGDDFQHGFLKNYFDNFLESVSTGYGFLYVGKADKFLRIRETTLLEHRITQSVVNRIVLDQMHFFLNRRKQNKEAYFTSNEPNEMRDAIWNKVPLKIMKEFKE